MKRSGQVFSEDVTEKKKMSNKLKLKISFCLLGVALIIAATVTYAWFTLSGVASVSSMHMTITAGVKLRVDTVDHGDAIDDYFAVITNEMIDAQLSTTTLTEMMLDPLTSQYGVEFRTQRGTLKTANDKSYLEVKLYFIASEDMWVHLTSENSTEGGEPDGTAVLTTSAGTKAEIVECVRVSFTADGATRIYEPNKGAAVASQTTFDIGDADNMVYSDETRLFELTANESKEVIVRVWIEGEDPQCDDDVASSDLDVRLCFKGTDDSNSVLE